MDQNPNGWQMTGDIGTWAERWADEIMPLAKEAHSQLTSINFERMTRKPPKVRCTWTANMSGSYEDWAAKRTQEQLAKAGFRLAAMLRAIYD